LPELRSTRNPYPPDDEEIEEGFNHFGEDNVDPVFLPIEPAESLQTFAAPQLMGMAMALSGDLPSYDEEAVSKFDSAHAVSLVRYLAEDIGPRLTGTPQEWEAAEYFKSLLESYGFEATIETYPRTTTLNVGQVTSPNTALPGGPNWQMRASFSAKFTEDDPPVQAQVIYAGTGQSAADFPVDTAGKIVMMNYSGTASTRNTAVVNAVSRGAVGVILVQTNANAAPPGNFTLSTPQPDVPVVGGGRAHLDWINSLLNQGPLTLTITTHRYVNPPIINVVGVKRAVSDPEGTAPIIMVGGHIDSVLGAPGASDNASGSSAAIEIARVLSQYELDKEIRIGGWGAEESGLLGANRYVATLNAATRARFVGYWNMDMVASPHAPLRLWALTPNGQSNFVVQSTIASAARVGYAPFDFCRLGSSDHVPFYNAGIPAALYIWINYTKPANCATSTGSYSLETIYHRPADTMENISQERMQISLNVIGGAAFHSALNAVTLSAATAFDEPITSATVRADCGDGWRNLGSTDSNGVLETVIPHATCDFSATAADESSLTRLHQVDVHGDLSLDFPAPPVLEPFVEPDPVLLYGSATAFPNVTYSAFDLAQASCEPTDTSSVGAKSLLCTASDESGNTATTPAFYNVIYDFAGFFDPVSNPPALNIANAGRVVPLKWHLTDAFGEPVTGLAGVVVTAPNLTCSVEINSEPVEEYAAGKSGLQNLGDGYYQFNWSIPKNYANSCKTLNLDLGEGPGMERQALFQFVK
jgi:hypothetical protein